MENLEPLKYDSDREMYILTKEYINAKYGNSFLDDGILEDRLLTNSMTIYNYIYSVGNTNNKPIVDYILHQTTKGKVFMLDLLSAQMKADLKHGNNSLGDIPMINIQKGTVLDRQAMYDDILCVNAKQILNSSASRLGLNIVYTGVYPPYVWAKYRGLAK